LPHKLPEFASFGRFLEPALLILISLADGSKHGYAMMEDIDQLCTIRLGAGTLYGALTRLEAQGLIEALPAVERRRPYQLTALGMHTLRQQLTDIQAVTTAGLQRLAAQ
jgi:DNA-binding PadR family transcriptional regulator